MRVAVTGSSGLLGGAVSDALEYRGAKVMRIDIFAAPNTSTRIVDLTVEQAAQGVFENVDAVVHCAGIPRPIGLSATKVFTTNTSIAFNVTEAAVQATVPIIINASSVSVFGYPFYYRPIRPTQIPVGAAQPLAPQDAYGLSKLTAEHIVGAAVARGVDRALNLRLPWIQTPESFTADTAASAASGDDVRNLWAYIAVTDAAEIIVAACERLPAGVTSVAASAPDTFSSIPSSELVASTWPDLECNLSGRASLLDNHLVGETFGFEPARSLFTGGGDA